MSDYITPGVKHTGVKKIASRKRQVIRPGVADVALPGRGQPMLYDAPAHVPMLIKSKGDLSNCSISVTPACIVALYGIPEPGNTAQAGNQMAVFEEGD